ncbi:LysE family translocator [Acetobacteraceae bacterium]|nr:LysE family translocator [Acetobacteraceae bacterium]
MISPLISSLSTFIVTATLLSIAPGPEIILTLTVATSPVRKMGKWIVAGVASGMTLWALATPLGLSAIFTTNPKAFQILKWLGVGYLLYLSVRLLLESCKKPHTFENGAAPLHAVQSAKEAFQQGILSALLNPNVAVFFVLMFPTFIPSGFSAAQIKGILLLQGGIEVIIMTLYLTIVVLAAVPLKKLLDKGIALRFFYGISGLLLLLCAAKLFMAQPPV